MGVSAAIRSGTPTDQQGGATLGKVRTAYSTAVAPHLHGLTNSLQKLWTQSDLHPGRSARRAHLAPMRRPDIDGAVRTLCRGMVLPEGMRMIL
jgi:hypothetical protein